MTRAATRQATRTEAPASTTAAGRAAGTARSRRLARSRQPLQRRGLPAHGGAPGDEHRVEGPAVREQPEEDPPACGCHGSRQLAMAILVPRRSVPLTGVPLNVMRRNDDLDRWR